MNTVDIIIFSGQSNMQGQSDCLSENEIVENAYEYKFLEDEMVPLKNPVGENITYKKECGIVYNANTNQKMWLETHVTGSACYGHTNLVPEFVRAYKGNNEQGIIAVHIAKGSTQISEWLNGTPGYEIIKEKTLAAIKKTNEKYEIGNLFFVWLQGESDAVAGNNKVYYKEKLLELYDSLKKDLNIDKFCIIRVGRFTNDERDLEIISAQDEICAENDSFIMLNTEATTLNEDPLYMHPTIRGHYSAKGLEKLGKKSGLQLKKINENMV